MPPPTPVITKFIELSKAYSVSSDGRVSSRVSLDYRDELRESERIVVEVLRESPLGILDREQISTKCVARGMSPVTAGAVLATSVVIEHLKTDAWTLVGFEISPGDLRAHEDSMHEKTKPKRVIDYGWESDGSLRIEFKLPRPPVNVIGIPAGVAKYVSGKKFAVRDAMGQSLGTITVDDTGSSWGYARFISGERGKEGDVLIARFELAEHNVTLVLQHS